MVENKEYFIMKWQERLVDDDLLKRYKVKQFIRIMMESEIMTEFGIDLYFTLIEKMTVYDDARVVVRLLDGTELECEV